MTSLTTSLSLSFNAPRILIIIGFLSLSDDGIALKAEAARWQSVMRGPAKGVGPAFTPTHVPPSEQPPAGLERDLTRAADSVDHPRGGAKGWQTDWSYLRLCVALDERQEGAKSRGRLPESFLGALRPRTTPRNNTLTPILDTAPLRGAPSPSLSLCRFLCGKRHLALVQ
jgi:hypothetical protein